MRHLFTAVLLLLCLHFSQAAEQKPDFRFPKTVASDAQSDLKRALKSDDGEGVVDALVRYSLAWSSISEENLHDITSCIEQVAASEQRPDIRALLLHLEARVIQAHPNRWQHLDLNQKLDSLFDASVRDVDSLAHYPITLYPRIIDLGENPDSPEAREGQRLIPTVAHFVLYHSRQMGKEWPEKTEQYLQLLTEKEKADRAEQNRVYEERQFVNAEFNSVFSRCDSIRLKLSYRNVHQLRIELLRIPDGQQEERLILRKQLKSAYQADIALNDTLPNTDLTQTVALPPLGYGNYVLMLSYVNRSGERVLPDSFYQSDKFTVTDVEEVGVLLSERNAKRREDTRQITLLLDRNTGRPIQPDARDRYYQHRNYHPGVGLFQDTVYQLQALTDRGLYRPGETVHYTVLLSAHTIDEHHPLQGRTVVAVLLNTQRQEVKQDTLLTDGFGQAVSSFQLPEGERTGRYSIQLRAYNDLRRHYSLASSFESFSVSEYKAPTFSISMSDTPSRVSAADTSFTIRGRVTTFSGLPVKHRNVKVGIMESWWYWYRNHGPDADEEFDYEAAVMTDADGCFVLHVPMVEFVVDDNDKKNNQYLRAVATCTNAGGETQSEQCNLMIEGVRFSEDDDAGSDLNPVQPLEEHLTDPTQLADSMIPADQALWIHPMFRQQKADKEALVRIGTSVADAYIYYIASDQHGVLDHGWLHYAQPGLHDFTYPMPQPAAVGQQPHDVELHLSFLAIRNGEITTFESQFTPKTDLESIRISLVTFRDHLLPGGTESWTFRIQGDRLNLTEQRSRLMLTLYDHALDEIEPFSWSYNTTSVYRRACWFDYSHYFGRHCYGDAYIEPLHLLSPSWPVLHLYGEHFFDVRSRSRGPVKYRAMAAGNAVDFGTIMLEEDTEALQDAVVVGYGMQSKSLATGTLATTEESAEVPMLHPAEAAKSLSAVKVREGQRRLALWEPMLTSDSAGTVSLTFEVPDQNTSWHLQALALAPWLSSGRLDTTLLAQRPLMVQPSLPRFVRQGDRLSLSGLVLNATDHTQKVTAMVEVFDPRTRQTIVQKALRLQLEERGQHAVDVMLQVPDTLTQLAYSIRAVVDGGEAAGSGDGEQRMLPVLPAVSPVIETIPFYLNPGDSAYTIQLPESLPEGVDLQMEWCDNPVVYCLEALPSLMNETFPTSTSLAHRLFAYAVSEQVVHRYPVAMADSLLFELQKLQNPDGGFSWIDYPDRHSSLSATAEVLQLLGELHQLDAYPLPEPMTTRALAYYDRHVADAYSHLTRKQRKHLNVDFYNFYLYLRSLFPGHPMKTQSRKLYSTALAQCAKRWGELSLSGRGYTALALHRQPQARYKRQASVVVESLRQFALTHPSRGMYWDQLEYSGYRWLSNVSQTSLLLQAFAAIDPRTEELDQIRKWLLLEKQTTQWGSSSLAADAVFALLSSGSEWKSRSLIESLRYDSVHDRLLWRDSLSVLRPLASTTRQVSIPAAAADHPSWGAVYMRYAAPIRTALSAYNQELRLQKELLDERGQLLSLEALANDSSLLHVGDRVTVRLRITAEREMSEVMITDERAACLEPADQLSGYHWGRELGYYMEPLDQRTLLFIPRLPRGVHWITYDLYVTSPGQFALGLAHVQCQYAPMFNAHTEGRIISIIPRQ